MRKRDKLLQIKTQINDLKSMIDDEIFFHQSMHDTHLKLIDKDFLSNFINFEQALIDIDYKKQIIKDFSFIEQIFKKRNYDFCVSSYKAEVASLLKKISSLSIEHVLEYDDIDKVLNLRYCTDSFYDLIKEDLKYDYILYVNNIHYKKTLHVGDVDISTVPNIKFIVETVDNAKRLIDTHDKYFHSDDNLKQLLNIPKLKRTGVFKSEVFEDLKNEIKDFDYLIEFKKSKYKFNSFCFDFLKEEKLNEFLDDIHLIKYTGITSKLNEIVKTYTYFPYFTYKGKKFEVR